MSIKTIDSNLQSKSGVKKKINAGAEKMVFDILQSTQYSTPIPSTVRELVTNGCDSQREKEIAIEILTGVSKVEDYYIERHGAQYEDSNFDPSYYDLKYLDTERNRVTIEYIENQGVGYCDTVIITDHGVGIGGKRLEGVLELGFSTKRNTSQNYGAFGLGAKVALSTGVDFYSLESFYNGKRVKANCYNYKTDFLISKFGKDGLNPSIIFSDGSKVYYEETDSKNKTIISFGVKRHNRSKYREAVEEQLIYLDNVDFYITDEYGHRSSVHIHPTISYNSDNLIISDTYVYSKPHIVLTKDFGSATGVNYGFVDFKELELDQLRGPVAFKCPARQVVRDPETGAETVIQDGVDVTPSREKVIWNENTKNYILSVIEAASEEASVILEESLNETDYVKWWITARSLTSSAKDNTLLSKLAGVISQADLNPKFKIDGKKLSIRDGITPRATMSLASAKVNVEGGDVDLFYEQDITTVINTLLSNYDSGKIKILYIDSGDRIDKEALLYSMYEDSPEISEESYTVFVVRFKDFYEDDSKSSILIRKLFIDSDLTQEFNSVEVPEEWLNKHKKALEVYKENRVLSPKDQRELEDRVVVHSYRYNDDYYQTNKSRYTKDKIEPKKSTIYNDKNLTYYGFAEDENRLTAAYAILYDDFPEYESIFTGRYFYHSESKVSFVASPPTHASYDNTLSELEDFTKDYVMPVPQILRISKNLESVVAKNPNYRHIDEFFLTLTPQGGYTMHKSVIKWYTSKIVSEIKEMQYLYCLKDINQEMFDKYKLVYDAAHSSDSRTDYIYKSALTDHMKALLEFQDLCNTTDDAEVLAAKSKELFVLEMPPSLAVHDEVYNAFKELKEWANGVSVMLTNIKAINWSPNSDFELSDDLIKELKIYLNAKSKLSF